MKYILLSGSEGGLGKATAKKLIENGYHVIGVDIVEGDNKIKNFTPFKCDLTNDLEVKFLVDKVKQITPKLDAIINLVGMFTFQSIVEGSEEDFRKIFEVNFFAVYKINRAFFDLLDKGCKIINMSSEEGVYSPQPFVGYYSISKGALDMYNDVLRRECNYLDIKVVKIIGGSFKTNMLKKVMEEYDVLVKNSQKFKQPLTKLKYMMDNELSKNHSPNKLGNLILKILKKKNPKIAYKINKSFALSFLNLLPEKLQDKIYVSVIK